MEPLKASSIGGDLVATGDNVVTVRDVVVGEVWLCSGQSNMELAVRDTRDAAEEIAAADFPLIRQLKLRSTVAALPAEAVSTSGWEPASPKTVGAFTGIGYYFARQIHAELGVPIGLLNASVGSTPVESWMDASTLAADPEFAVVGERWTQVLAEYPAKKAEFEIALTNWTKAEASARAVHPENLVVWLKNNPKPIGPAGPGHRWTPAGLYNGMVHPLVPYAVRGFLWYQGERNAADDHVNEYHALFRAMIQGWRAQFGQGDLPFFWVNLPNLVQGEPTGQRWAFLREAQTQTLELPHTGQAVTIDIGDPRNIHPANKQDVAARLVLLAKNRVYGLKCVDTGPTFLRTVAEGAALRVFFVGSHRLHVQGGLVRALELAGDDHVFYPAIGLIEGETLVVSSPAVAAPIAVRYAWTNSPEANLYNESNLPAVPFRSDCW